MNQSGLQSTPSALREFVEQHTRLFVLTGAGCSTESGIPDYRDADGEWKRSPPVMLQHFIGNPAVRARYWARSLIGWPRIHAARPNAAHFALNHLQRRGQVELLATQNVDRLHQLAGSHDALDLHGRLDVIRCMSCPRRLARDRFQLELQQRNAGWMEFDAR